MHSSFRFLFLATWDFVFHLLRQTLQIERVTLNVAKFFFFLEEEEGEAAVAQPKETEV